MRTAMRIRTIGYYFGEAFRSLRRNSWMVLASVGTVAVSLLIVGISLITVLNTGYLAARVESNIEIIAYLKSDLSADDAMALNERIQAIPGVAKTQFVTKDQAMLEFRKQLGEQQNMVDALGGSNPLPHLYKVTTVSPQDVEKVANGLNAMPEAEKVDYGKGVVEKLFAITKWVRLIGISFIALLGFAAIFLIATTIRLTVFARRREIQIMKILGATNWFIRWPFLLEGMVIGFVGAFVAVLIVDSSYLAITDYITRELNFKMFNLQKDTNFLVFLGIAMLGVGTLIGTIGSGISLRKFLKV